MTSNVFSSITTTNNKTIINNNNTAPFQNSTINNGMTPHVAEEARRDV